MYFCSIYIPYFFNFCTVCTYPLLFFLSSRHMSVEFLQMLFVYFLSTNISLSYLYLPPFLLSFNTTKQHIYIPNHRKESCLQDSSPEAGCDSNIFFTATVRSPGGFLCNGNCVSHYIKKRRQFLIKGIIVVSASLIYDVVYSCQYYIVNSFSVKLLFYIHLKAFFVFFRHMSVKLLQIPESFLLPCEETGH